MRGETDKGVSLEHRSEMYKFSLRNEDNQESLVIEETKVTRSTYVCRTTNYAYQT